MRKITAGSLIVGALLAVSVPFVASAQSMLDLWQAAFWRFLYGEITYDSYQVSRNIYNTEVQAYDTAQQAALQLVQGPPMNGTIQNLVQLNGSGGISNVSGQTDASQGQNSQAAQQAAQQSAQQAAMQAQQAAQSAAQSAIQSAVNSVQIIIPRF